VATMNDVMAVAKEP